MPVVPSCLLEPAWVEFCALSGGDRPQFHPGHPLGCHRRRVPGRVVFEHVVAALVHGSGYERIATPGCSDRTIRRRLAEWAQVGLAEALHAAALRAYDQIIGLELGDVAVDGCLTKAPCGGRAGRAVPGGPAQGRAETLGGQRRLRHPAGHRLRRGEPARLAAAGPHPGGRQQQLDGILPEDRTCHLDRGYDSRSPASCSMSWALTARSPARAFPPPSRPAPAGSWNAPTRG